MAYAFGRARLESRFMIERRGFKSHHPDHSIPK